MATSILDLDLPKVDLLAPDWASRSLDRASLGHWAARTPIGVALVRWFRRRRALALSISGTGMSIGGLLTPLVVLAMSRFGWRWTAFASGVLITIVGLLLAQIVRSSPAVLGLTPDGDPPRSQTAETPAGVRVEQNFTPRQAMQ